MKISEKITKDDVQCVVVYRNPHLTHKIWMESVSSRKFIPYIPERYQFFGVPLVTQMMAFVKGFFIPNAKVYLIEGVATVPSVLFKRGKVICINSDTFFFNLKKSSWIKKFYSNLLLKKIDGFITTSKMMEEIQKETGKPSEIVYPFMDRPELFKINPDFESNNIFLIGARYEKGADVVIDVFKKYKKINPDATLTIVGTGEFYVEETKKAGGSAPGFVKYDNISQFFEKAGIYLNPSRHDSFGVNVIESMAAGIPPLVSEHCGAKEVVRKVSEKLIVPLDSDEIIKRIEWLKSDRKRYFEMSMKCKSLAKEFSKEKSIAQFKKNFYALLDKI